MYDVRHTNFRTLIENIFLSTRIGGIAQLVERCLCKADVSGSSPLTSTT
jgi:hypothetical protein